MSIETVRVHTDPAYAVAIGPGLLKEGRELKATAGGN